MIMKSSYSDKDFIISDHVLGRGGFATVYRAEHKLWPNRKIKDRYVAIKKIAKASMKKLPDRENEFNIHSILKHPNIIKLYGKYEDKDNIYLILELCNEGSLEDYLRDNGGPLEEAKAYSFFKQIVPAVQYLHKHLVLHRDIALKNILLSENGTAKLADFGLSKKLNYAGEVGTTFAGTPNYMSPEAVMKLKHTLKRDCWSLGCVLYTLLVGKTPFKGINAGHTMANVVMNDLPPLPDDMSWEAKKLISSLLVKEESERAGIEDILESDFFKKYEKDYSIPKSYRNGDSGTGSMASSATSSSKTSRRFSKTLHSGMDSINSGSAELRRNQENTYKNKCLDTIQSSGFSGCSGSMRRIERSSTHSKRERFPLKKMIPSYGSDNAFHTEKSRNKSSCSYNHSICSNSKLENKKCRDPYCRFEEPTRDNHKEHLSNLSCSKIRKSENIGGSQEYSCDEPSDNFKNKRLRVITEPLNTNRLSPMRKLMKKRKVVISISNEGKVYIEHLENKLVSSICEISRDGKRISFYEPEEKYEVTDILRTREKDLKCPSNTFKYFTFEENIKNIQFDDGTPEQPFNDYHLAKKVIDIVKAKTPKVIIFSKKGKCDMMENSPNPDYQMKFYNGGMVKISCNKLSYVDENGRNHPNFSDGKEAKEYKNIWKDFVMVQEQCDLVAKHLEALEDSDIPIFPVIFGKQPPTVLPKENYKENHKSQSGSFISLKNSKTGTLPNSQASQINYNHLLLEKDKWEIRSIDVIQLKLKRKPELQDSVITAEYFDDYQLKIKISKDETKQTFIEEFLFRDPCGRKISKLNSTLNRRLEQDILGIYYYFFPKINLKEKTSDY